MKDIYLYIVVSVSGAVVLALEILGTRILGPFYGVSLYLWSALISVTLVSLSIGYAVGGRLADKVASPRRLSIILGAAGVWSLLIIVIKHLTLLLFEKIGLRFAVLGTAFILFAPPLTLLGMVIPFAIRLKTQKLDEVGRNAGNLFAISTMASVVSALLVGFFLIPNVGVNRLMIIIGGILLATALGVTLTIKKTTSTTIISVLFVLIIILLPLIVPGERPDPEHGLVAIEQSPYGELRVLDTDAGRHLLIDGGIHSLVDTATWNSYCHYAAVMDLPKRFFANHGKMLLIGLGGGSLVKQYAREKWEVDAVEIDPSVIRLAFAYFGLSPKEASIYQMDGRQFLENTSKTYDLIIVDAFGSSSIPFHLVTKEAIGLINSRLASDGVVGVNFETSGWYDPIVNKLTITLQQYFKEVIALPMEEPPDKFGNVVLIAANRTLEPRQDVERNETLDPNWRFGPGYQMVHAWDNKFTADSKNAQVLTDDLNPIDLRSEAINVIARKELHRYFEDSGMSW